MWALKYKVGNPPITPEQVWDLLGIRPVEVSDHVKETETERTKAALQKAT